MTFDLHIHTELSDGSFEPEELVKNISGFADYVTVCDHDTAMYHSMDFTGCSFRGIEITSDIQVAGRGILSEVLFYGFGKEDIHVLNELKDIHYNMWLPELCEFLKPIRERTDTKLFLAHPIHCARSGIPFWDILDYCGEYVDGFECLHSSANEREVIMLLEYCLMNEKLASGGTDNHGTEKEITPYLWLVEDYENLFQWIPKMYNKGDN
jgi:hypothetical protein